MYLRDALKCIDENGNLALGGSRVTSLPEGLVVPGDLDVSFTPVGELPADIKLGGDLRLEGSKIKRLPEGLVVPGLLDLRNTPIEEFPTDIKLGSSLILSKSRIKRLPSGLVVPGYLDLRDTLIEELPTDIKIGDCLYLYRSRIKQLHEGVAIGGKIYDFDGPGLDKVRHLKDGEYVEGEYLFADRILTPVKKRKTVGVYTLYIGKIKGRHVVSDGKNFAHCASLREGIADLLFKSAEDRGADQYKGLSLDTELTVSEMVTMYRVITGACKRGSERFVQSLGDKVKDRYTIREVIELTKDQYGSQKFAEFFGA